MSLWTELRKDRTENITFPQVCWRQVINNKLASDTDVECRITKKMDKNKTGFSTVTFSECVLL